jgi:outer membrane protein OmpA-like peptidoglycan-associated protein
MKFPGRAAILFLSSLLLVSPSFADDKKADAKDKDAVSSNSPATARASNPAPAAAADAASQPAATVPTPAPTPLPAPPAKSYSTDSEASLKWDPMPALDGNPGLFTLETGEILPKGGFDLAYSVNKISRMPGSVTILQQVPSFGVGITNWLSFFFQWQVHDHIHVDNPAQLSLSPLTIGNPQYPNSPPATNTIYRSLLPGQGVAPGYVEDFPFASSKGGGYGELDMGFNIGILSERKGKPFSLSIRNDLYIPTRTGLGSLLTNQVQYGNFNYGIGLQASKHILHRSILATINWSYRFTRDQSFTVLVNGAPQTQVLNLSDQMGVGFGMLIFPDKRWNIITEYDGLIYIGSGIQNTTFGARDPVDNVTGLRFYVWKHLGFDVGYRYSLNLSNHLDRNGFIAKIGGMNWPEKAKVPDSLTSSCSVDKPSVMQGSNDLVQASVAATDAWGYPLTYTWTATGGQVSGAGPAARWDSTGVGPGSYTLTAHVDNGAGTSSTCSTAVTVQPRAPMAPTMSCSADRSTVLVGERPLITAIVNDPSGTALNYSWHSNGGQIVGSGSSVQLDTSGLSPGTYAVTGRVENGAGGAADCSAPITVQAPPPPPQATRINECPFAQGSAVVNNVCKRVLDDLAVRLQSEPKAKAVLVGFAEPKEHGASKLAARRAENAKNYLAQKKGVDAARVDVRSAAGTESEGKHNRRVDVVWVPDGATY